MNIYNSCKYTCYIVGIIRIWDIKTGKLIQTQEPEKNTKHVTSDIMFVIF